MRWELFQENTEPTIFVTTDPNLMDRDIIFHYLHHTAYWCKGIPYDVCMKSLDNSHPFSLIHGDKQIGFARLVTDYATFAYLADVFVLDEFQGKGYGKFIVRCVNSWLDTNNIRTSLLLTRDAQTLYSNLDWTHPSDIKRVMRYKERISNFYNN